MYRNMSNCLYCGRLIAPSSGITGTTSYKLFCGRKCLNVYYDEQPNLWEMEEEKEQQRLELEKWNEEQAQILLEKTQKEQKEKKLNYLIVRWSLFFVLFLFAFFISNGWVWLAFTLYTLCMLFRWVNTD